MSYEFHHSYDVDGFLEELDRDERKYLPKVCTRAYKKYKGIHKPRCCGGNGCQVCWLIYEAQNEQ